MLERQPMTAVRVSSLDKAIEFYVGRLGMKLVELERSADRALIDLQGFPVLFAGSQANDLASRMNASYDLVEPAGTLHIVVPELDTWDARLRGQPTLDLRRVEKPWGDRTLELTDPDGYTVRFWAPVWRSPEQIVALYAAGPGALMAALDGLDDAALDRSLRPGSWTMRQIVHHLVDSEISTLPWLIYALAQPGRDFQGNRHSQDAWVVGLDHARRPVQPSIVLFGAIRTYVESLLRHLPDAQDRYVRTPGGDERRVGALVSMLGAHAFEHIEEIATIRRSFEIG